MSACSGIGQILRSIGNLTRYSGLLIKPVDFASPPPPPPPLHSRPAPLPALPKPPPFVFVSFSISADVLNWLILSLLLLLLSYSPTHPYPYPRPHPIPTRVHWPAPYPIFFHIFFPLEFFLGKKRNKWKQKRLYAIRSHDVAIISYFSSGFTNFPIGSFSFEFFFLFFFHLGEPYPPTLKQNINN